MRFAPTFTLENGNECKTAQIAAILYLSMKIGFSAVVQNWCKSSASYTRASVVVQECKRLYIRRCTLHLAPRHKNKAKTSSRNERPFPRYT